MHDLEPQDIGDIFKQINNHQMNALMVMSQHKIKDENIIINTFAKLSTIEKTEILKQINKNLENALILFLHKHPMTVKPLLEIIHTLET
mgnify:CR=1 FL=1